MRQALYKALRRLVKQLSSCYDLTSYNQKYCNTMTTVSVSPKFQVVIPKEIREALNLFSGQRMEVKLNKGKVEFVPEKTILSYRGRWPGVDSTIVRDADRV
jgi:AbrB family looped-hinge helix DNA binding protein